VCQNGYGKAVIEKKWLVFDKINHPFYAFWLVLVKNQPCKPLYNSL